MAAQHIKSWTHPANKLQVAQLAHLQGPDPVFGSWINVFVYEPAAEEHEGSMVSAPLKVTDFTPDFGLILITLCEFWRGADQAYCNISIKILHIGSNALLHNIVDLNLKWLKD